MITLLLLICNQPNINVVIINAKTAPENKRLISEIRFLHFILKMTDRISRIDGNNNIIPLLIANAEMIPNTHKTIEEISNPVSFVPES